MTAPSGRERTFARDELIVSKTDPKGRLVYVNDVFLEVSGFRESEIIGQPHSIIRHPEMPRAVFKLLWDVILGGKEIFAYVNNMAKNGDNYWVFAHVTPSRTELLLASAANAWQAGIRSLTLCAQLTREISPADMDSRQCAMQALPVRTQSSAIAASFGCVGGWSWTAVPAP